MHALSAAAHWGVLLAWATLLLFKRVCHWPRPDAYFKVLICAWLLATLQTHQYEVQFIQQLVGFGSPWIWALLFWLLLLPLLLASWDLIDRLAMVWRRQPLPDGFELQPSIVLLQLALWLALIIIVAQWRAVLALSAMQFLLLAAVGFGLALQVSSSEQARWPLTRLGIGMALMAGSLAQVMPLQHWGISGVLAWVFIVIGLIVVVFYLGWRVRGKPEDQAVADVADLASETMNAEPMSADEQAEVDVREAQYQQQQKLAERVAADLASEEAKILAEAQEIQQQTPEQRAEKLRAAIAQAQAQEAADKWTRE